VTLDEISRALRTTLEKAAGNRNNTAWGFGYYGDELDAGGWIDCQIEALEEALFDAGWTPPAPTESETP
jgi:hypothetical protein